MPTKGNIFQRIYSPSGMVKPSFLQGGLPGAKEAYSRLFKLAWPAMLESMFIAVIGFVDTIMVSSLGAGAISAVGITAQPKFLMMAPIIALNVGVTAIVARRKGEGDIEGAQKALRQGVLISLIFCVLMSAASVLFARELMQLAGAQPDFIGEAIVYFRIVMTGQFFACLGMTINAAQRGFGNTKIAMRSNITANVINIIFNYFLINGVWIFPRLGVKGAAIATAMGGTAAFIMALISVLRRHSRELSLIAKGGGWRFDRRTVSGMTKVGSSALIEQLFLRFGFFTFAKLIANLGTNPFATHQIAMNILHLSFAVADGIGVAATALVGQNLGAKRPDLSLMYGRMAQRSAMTVAACLGLIFVIFRRYMIMLFSSDMEIITLGEQVVVIIAVMLVFQASQTVMFGCLRGAGDSRYLAIISFMSVSIIRPGLSWILCYPVGWGLVGAWLGMLVDQTTRMALSSLRFGTMKWSKIEL